MLLILELLSLLSVIARLSCSRMLVMAPFTSVLLSLRTFLSVFYVM